MVMQLISLSFFAIVLFMTAGFVIAQIKKDVSIVDVFWGLGFILIAWLTLFKNDLFLIRQIIVTILITIWGIRLSGYILWRKKGEDARYTTMKQSWGKWAFLYSYLMVFLLQGFLLLLIAMPIIIINASSIPGFFFLDYIGLFLWCFGFIYEVIADKQLYQFLSLKTGKIMNHGLWHYSRHPNYFGEWLMWWGIWIISLSVPYGWICIISPITITYILFFLSTPITESQFINDADFFEYKKRTPAIIPWPLKGKK